MTNQNKEGIGYDENNFWWEKLYNNTVKKVNIEPRINRFALEFGVKMTPFETLNSWEIVQEKYSCTKNTEGMITNMSDQKQDEICNRAAYKTKVPYFTLGGKLERIIEPNEIFSNAKSLVGATTENMTYRKINAETDVEESEHEMDNAIAFPHLLPPEEESTVDFRSKSTRKKHRRKINKLAEQLDTCNLEEQLVARSLKKKSVRRLGLMRWPCKSKVYLKMKRDRQKRISNENPSGIKKVLKSELNESQLHELVALTKMPNNDRHINLDLDPKRQLEILLDKDKRRLSRGRIFDIDLPTSYAEIKARENQKQIDNAYKAYRSQEFPKSIEGNEITDEQDKDWLKIAINLKEKTIEKTKFILDRKSLIEMDVPMNVGELCRISMNYCKTHNTEFVSHSDVVRGICRKSYLHKSNDKILQKKDRSKNVKKIADKLLRGAAEYELNSVIKNLTAVGLTDEVSASTIKKRPTQTHLTPV